MTVCRLTVCRLTVCRLTVCRLTLCRWICSCLKTFRKITAKVLNHNILEVLDWNFSRKEGGKRYTEEVRKEEWKAGKRRGRREGEREKTQMKGERQREKWREEGWGKDGCGREECCVRKQESEASCKLKVIKIIISCYYEKYEKNNLKLYQIFW